MLTFTRGSTPTLAGGYAPRYPYTLSCSPDKIMLYYLEIAFTISDFELSVVLYFLNFIC